MNDGELLCHLTGRGSRFLTAMCLKSISSTERWVRRARVPFPNSSQRSGKGVTLLSLSPLRTGSFSKIVIACRSSLRSFAFLVVPFSVPRELWNRFAPHVAGVAPWRNNRFPQAEVLIAMRNHSLLAFDMFGSLNC